MQQSIDLSQNGLGIIRLKIIDPMSTLNVLICLSKSSYQ